MSRARPAPSSRAGRALSNAGLGLLSLLSVLVGAELCLRLLAPQHRPRPGRFQPHAQLGWAFAPDRRTPFTFPGIASHPVTTNSDGFRDAPFDGDALESRRIAVLGDSFVANLAVRDEEVFTELMERELRGVSVMNLGVNGYGQTQEYLLLPSVLRRFVPDLVVVVIYLRKDLTDNPGGGNVGISPGAGRLPHASDSGKAARTASPSDDAAGGVDQNSSRRSCTVARSRFIRCSITTSPPQGGPHSPGRARRYRQSSTKKVQVAQM